MDKRNEILKSWLDKHKERWVMVKELTDSGNKDSRLTLNQALDFMKAYRVIASDLSLAQTIVPNSQVTHVIEALLARASSLLYKQSQNLWQTLLYLLKVEIGEIIYQMRNKIIVVVLLFFTFIFMGWWLITTYPELVSLFASSEMIDGVQQGKLWTDGLLNIMPSSLLALSIITNNVTVTLFAFAMGVFYGLGTLYIIGLNGLMLGGIFAFTHQYGMAKNLLSFIIAHGVVELSVICLAGAAGMYLGEALARPGSSSRVLAFQHAVSKAGKLLAVCIPFLIIAGVIEGYISPNDDYSLTERFIVGLSFELVFILVLTGVIWRRRA